VYAGGLVLAAFMSMALAKAWHSPIRATISTMSCARSTTPDWDVVDGAPKLTDFLELVRAALPEEAPGGFEQMLVASTPVDLVGAFDAIGTSVSREMEPLDPSPRVNLEGTRIVAIDPDGAGHRLGLRIGDVLHEIDGHPVSNREDVRDAWSRHRREIEINVTRDDQIVIIRDTIHRRFASTFLKRP